MVALSTTIKRDRKSILVIMVMLLCLFVFRAEVLGEEVTEKIPASAVEGLMSGVFQELIILFDDSEIENDAAIMRELIGVPFDNEEILAVKAARYMELKNRVLSEVPEAEFEVLKDYSHLPMMFLKVRSISVLDIFRAHPEVVRLYPNGVRQHFLSQSLPLINQPAVAASGKVGTGTAVSVIDTGVDYTRAAFGSCSSPGVPAGCKVIYAEDFATPDGSLDDDGHGTNVAGIVIGVAPDTRIAALDVFEEIPGCGLCAYDSDIAEAINWSIANRATYNIVAMNMSLGGGGYTAPCPGDSLAAPIANAKSAGILSAIASGNNGYTDRISSPGCVPAAVSVGAVYDSNLGAMYWGICSDTTTYADKVTCFSNSASFLTILAPGSVITAAGYSFSGTSQATPHIAGSTAVLRGQGAFPSDTVDQTVSRMTSTGVSVTDPKNGIVKPRIDLLAAAGGGTQTYSILGKVANSRGTGISGVTMTLSGAGSGTTTTDGSGNYTFSNLANGAYTVTPSKTGYTFSPTSRSVTISGSNITGVNFTGTSGGGGGGTYSISGRVTESGGTAISGVTMTLSGAGSGTTMTDGSGNYTFSGLSNGTYTVTPSKTGYTFSPMSRTVSISRGSLIGVDFIGTSGGGGGTFSISGKVATSRGTGISSVTMTLSGAGSGTTMTDGSGNYTFSGLSNGAYTVTPSKTGYTFSPTSRSVTISGSNVTGVNFTGTRSF